MAITSPCPPATDSLRVRVRGWSELKMPVLVLSVTVQCLILMKKKIHIEGGKKLHIAGEDVFVLDDTRVKYMKVMHEGILILQFKIFLVK